MRTMRSVQNAAAFNERTKRAGKSTTATKCQTRRRLMRGLKKKLKKAIEQENVELVREILESSSGKQRSGKSSSSFGEQIDEIRADLHLIEQTISSVIETSGGGGGGGSGALKRKASAESQARVESKPVRILLWSTSNFIILTLFPLLHL